MGFAPICNYYCNVKVALAHSHMTEYMFEWFACPVRKLNDSDEVQITGMYGFCTTNVPFLHPKCPLWDLSDSLGQHTYFYLSLNTRRIRDSVRVFDDTYVLVTHFCVGCLYVYIQWPPIFHLTTKQQAIQVPSRIYSSTIM